MRAIDALRGHVRGIGRYLARPDVRRDPWRLLARRTRYEVERRLFPARLARPRRVVFDGDLHIWVAPADVVDRSIYLYGVHEYRTACIFSALVPPGGVVVDAGAHIGQFTLLAAKRVGPSGRVLAFEPNPEVAQRLVANVSANRLRNVSVHAEALAATPGTAVLHLPDTPGNSGRASLHDRGGSSTSICVRCVRLDDVLARSGVTRLDLLKVDVEGAETEVLEGAATALQRYRPALIFEANDLGLLETLRRRGYRIFGVAEDLRLVELGPGDDPFLYREPWCALNLVALPS